MEQKQLIFVFYLNACNADNDDARESRNDDNYDDDDKVKNIYNHLNKRIANQENKELRNCQSRKIIYQSRECPSSVRVNKCNTMVISILISQKI